MKTGKQPDPNEILRPEQGAQMMNFSTSMMYELSDSGALPCIRFGIPSEGKRKKMTLRFYRKDIELFIKDHYSIT